MEPASILDFYLKCKSNGWNGFRLSFCQLTNQLIAVLFQLFYALAHWFTLESLLYTPKAGSDKHAGGLKMKLKNAGIK